LLLVRRAFAFATNHVGLSAGLTPNAVAECAVFEERCRAVRPAGTQRTSVSASTQRAVL